MQVGQELADAVNAGFRLKGYSTAKWCVDHKISKTNARQALNGDWTGPKARKLVARLVNASGALSLLVFVNSTVVDESVYEGAQEVAEALHGYTLPRAYELLNNVVNGDAGLLKGGSDWVFLQRLVGVQSRLNQQELPVSFVPAVMAALLETAVIDAKRCI